MIKTKWLIIFFAMIATGLVGEAWGVPSLPTTLYGTVKKDGANVPDGTVVSAWIGGVQYASTSTFTSGADSVYSINVPGDDPETPTKEGGVSGDVVSFSVGSQMVTETVVFSSGASMNLNLNIGSELNI